MSAVVRKKQGKELNWYTGKFSLYNLLSNSEKKQTLTLNEDQKLVIKIMFKNVVNEGEEDDTIKRFMNFFNNEIVVRNSKVALEGYETFKKFLDGMEGKYEYENGCLKITLGEKKFFVILTGDTRDKVKVIYGAQVMLEEK